MPPLRRGRAPAANRIFVDREAPQRVFEDAVFAIPADRSIVRVFYGVGGQGKTALCRELMRRTDAAADPSFAFLRRAELDLHARTKEDPDRLLVWIRNGFAGSGVLFPCFDLAFAIAWEATRGDEPLPVFTRQWLSRATGVGKFGVEEVSSLARGWLTGDTVQAAAGELVGSIPGIGFALKRIGNWSIEKGKRIYLEKTREALQQLYDGGEMKKPYELSRLLPWMLAQDLNAHLGDHPDERFVLFVDEYERVFDEGGAGSKWEVNPFDEHMRTLIAESNGLLAVFFSREQLPWGRDPHWRGDLDGHQHLLGGLADKDADVFLRAVPIDDAAIRRAIVAGARETASSGAPVYPLMLDLQVEHWGSLLAAGVTPAPELFSLDAASFEDRRLEIVQRVLRDYGAPLEATLERLSPARRFDRRAFEHVVRTFGTALPLDQFDRIAALSFVSKAADGYLSIHNLVAETIRESLSPQLRTASLEALFRHYSERAAAATARDISDDTIAALIEAAHVRLALGMEGYVGWLDEACTDIVGSAWSKNIIELWRAAANFAETRLGTAHADTGTALNNLATLLQRSGDLYAARPVHQRALAVLEKALGPEHPDTAVSLNNLATVLHDMGDHAAARPLYEQALAIREKVLGAEHPGTATGLDNLAALLHATGDYSAARPLYERALQIHESRLGSDHPRTARSLNNLAALLLETGDHAAARLHYERALSIRERALGPDHPATASSLHNLARLLKDSGDFQAARALYERARAIREAALGPEHPDTASSLTSLAVLLHETGDDAAARPLFEQALAIREMALGPDHPDTGRVRINLARLLIATGQPDEAAALAQAGLAAHHKTLGSAHATTVDSAEVTANALEAASRNDEAAAIRSNYGL